MDTDIDGALTALRASIQIDADCTLELKKNIDGSECTEKENRGEVMANLTLAYRHLEDAKMRVGKVFQAMDGGESCYKK